MAEPQDLELLRASILAHDAQFQELMCMIPPKYYITQPQLSLSSFETNGSNSRRKKKKTREPIDPETKRLQKRAKYDPDTLPTIPQLQGLNKSSESNLKSIPQLPSNEARSQESKEVGSSKGISPAPQLSRAELQAKLQQRIEVLQGSSQRKQVLSETQEASGMNGKEALLNLERKKRGEMRDRRRKERKEARQKEKQRKEEEMVLKKNKKIGMASKTPNNHPSGSGNLQKGQKALADLKTLKSPSEFEDFFKSNSNSSHPPSKPEKTSSPEAERSQPTIKTPATIQEPDLAFSALSFDLKQSSALGDQHHHGPRNPSWISKKPQEAKIALDRRDAYLSKLTPEARERAEESKKWEKANLQASGTKVMDDRKKIEKSLKRQVKEKKKKKNQWDERIKVVEKLKEDKQKKRNENIKQRKDQIRDKKFGSSSSGVKAKGNFKTNKSKNVKGF